MNMNCHINVSSLLRHKVIGAPKSQRSSTSYISPNANDDLLAQIYALREVALISKIRVIIVRTDATMDKKIY